VKAHGNRPGGRLSQLGSGPERVNGAVSFLLPFASPEPVVFRRRGVEKVPVGYEARLGRFPFCHLAGRRHGNGLDRF
jgi:hypothetical protein